MKLSYFKKLVMLLSLYTELCYVVLIAQETKADNELHELGTNP